jgi:putative Holliday junction resolvase
MIVVGLPLNMNGTPGPMSQKVDAFVAKLRERMGVPVITWDERLSTMMAERVLLEADMSRRRRKAVRDKVAAQVILQGFLDSLSAGATYDAL